MTATARILTRPSQARAPRAAVLAVEELLTRGGAWDDLLDRAGFANPFYGRTVLAAHAANGIGGRPLLHAVEDGQALLALLPLVEGRVGWWRPARLGWATPFTTHGTPLIAEDAAGEVVATLLDGLAARGGLVLLPMLALDHPSVGTFREALAARGWAAAEIGAFERPVLDRRASFDAYERDHLSASRRKGLRRRRSKLAELGTLAFASLVPGPGFGAAVEEFLSLERAGWKGRQASALASRPETAALARELFSGETGPVTPRIDLLRLEGRAVAASLALVCRGTAHMWKTAFDESLRAHAPGVVLEAEIIRAVHETRFAERLDSATVPGGILDELYPGRERIGDLLLAATTDVSCGRLEAIAEEERRRRAGLAALKRLRDRMRA